MKIFDVKVEFISTGENHIVPFFCESVEEALSMASKTWYNNRLWNLICCGYIHNTTPAEQKKHCADAAMKTTNKIVVANLFGLE